MKRIVEPKDLAATWDPQSLYDKAEIGRAHV